MKKIYNKARKKGLLPVFALLLATLLLVVLLLPEELNFDAPAEEFENNDVRITKILFSHASGFYEEPFTLKIKAPTREIYYTLDGTEPVRGQEGTYRYEGGIEIGDATAHENVHSLRTDVTTGFDLEAVETLSRGRRVMNYQVPDYPVDKCTILRAAFYTMDDERSEIKTSSYFVGYENREGYGTAKILSITTDPANLFDYDRGIYVTGRTFSDFAAADSFNNDDIWYRHFWWWWDANYNRRGPEWEREANVEFFSEDGSLLLEQKAGIRIQGGGSRGFLPKSLNLYARRGYDGNTRFHYAFFGDGFKAKRLTLTCGGDDCYTKIKDRLVAELAAGQGFATMNYTPCLLFLDGEFWGLYHLTEKYDEKYFSSHFNVPEEEVLEIKNNKVEIGTEDDLALYEEMKAFIEENDMSVEANYEKACELIDMDSFINYYAALIYCARCGDWPNGNFALWRTREVPAEETADDDSSSHTAKSRAAAADSADGHSAAGSADGPSAAADNSGVAGDPAEESSPYRDGRWRWILFDVNSDGISSELTDHDTLHYVLKANKMKMFASLSRNPEFRREFSERILEYGTTIFSPNSVDKQVDEYMEEMEAPMKLHFDRFFGRDSGLDFRQITDTEIRGFFKDRYDFVEKMLEDNFGNM